jgi:hypothetical protein
MRLWERRMARLDGGRRRPILAWALSRLLLVAMSSWTGYPHQRSAMGDVRFYRDWAAGLAHGHFPLDERWQYPPGAAAVLALPRLLPLSYTVGLVAVVLCADAAILAILLTHARHSKGSLKGAWFWVAGPVLLGPVVLYRFDMVPAVLAVGGLAAAGRPFLAGLLLGAGGMVKLWPAFLLPAARGRTGWRRAAAGLLLVLAARVAVLAVTGLLPHAGGFAGNQRARGLQVESVPATPWLVARLLGAGVRVEYSYGAFQVVGSLPQAVATWTTPVEAAVLAAYVLAAWRRRRQDPLADETPLGLAVLLLVVVVARVLSPQYLLWLLAVAAVGLTGHADRLSRVGRLLLVAAAMSQAVYPGLYNLMLRGAVVPSMLLVARNVVLVAATVLAVRAASTPPAASWRRPGASRTGDQESRAPAAASSPVPAPRSRPGG